MCVGNGIDQCLGSGLWMSEEMLMSAWMKDCRHISVYARSDVYSMNKFECSLSDTLAEGESSKGTVDRRASAPPG